MAERVPRGGRRGARPAAGRAAGAALLLAAAAAGGGAVPARAQQAAPPATEAEQVPGRAPPALAPPPSPFAPTPAGVPAGPAGARGGFDANVLRAAPAPPSIGAIEAFGVPRGGAVVPPGAPDAPVVAPGPFGFRPFGDAAGPAGGGAAFGRAAGGLRGEPGGEGPPRAFDIRPSLGVSLTATDNVRNTPDGRRADVGFTLLPGLYATADTARLVGSLGYFPSLTYFANTPGQSRISHLFNGAARAMVLENSLFLDLRAFGAVQAASGGFAPQGSTLVDRTNQIQSTSLQAAPYLVHRFGGLAVAQVGYAYRFSKQDGQSAFLAGSAQPFFTAQEAEGHEVFGVLRSGEDFGPLGLEARVVGTRFNGTGVLDGARRDFATLQARYAVNRWFTGLVEGGYEDQRYAGVRPYIVQEPIWSVGARLTPDEDSVVVARYGRRDGFNSAFLDASVGLGGRTRLDASYGETLGTSSRLSTDLLTNTSVDPLGNPVDSLSGFPVVLPFAGSPLGPLGGPLDAGPAGYAVPPAGGSFLALQSSLFRVRRAIATLTQTWPRDTVALSFVQQDIRPLATPAGITPFAQKASSVSLTWAHLLTRETSIAATAQYGRSTSNLAGDGDSYTARLLLAHNFSPTLVGSLQYAFTYRTNPLLATQFSSAAAAAAAATSSGRPATQNLLIATLRQAF